MNRKISDCFLIDNSAGSANLYDADETVTTYFATRYGVSSQTKGRYVNVPIFPFADVEVEDRCVALLLEAIKETGWARRSPFENADDDFAKRDLRLQYVFSSSDHHLIPTGYRIAVAEPEQLGRIVLAGNNHRGIVLFNPAAVIGYSGRGKSSYECVLAEFL